MNWVWNFTHINLVFFRKKGSYDRRIANTFTYWFDQIFSPVIFYGYSCFLVHSIRLSIANTHTVINKPFIMPYTSLHQKRRKKNLCLRYIRSCDIPSTTHYEINKINTFLCCRLLEILFLWSHFHLLDHFIFSTDDWSSINVCTQYK